MHDGRELYALGNVFFDFYVLFQNFFYLVYVFFGILNSIDTLLINYCYYC